MEFRLERDMREPVVAWLEAQEFKWARESYSPHCPVDFVAGRFTERVGRRRPDLIEGITVELKLNDVGCVLSQATANRKYVHLSYAAMPAGRCSKMRAATLERFRAAGVGLLSVTPERVDMLIPPTRSNTMDEWMIKNLWRRVARKATKMIAE